ncbi:MAG: copper amine oxidase N-terminal domain-containing protein [Clostridia bacterium]|nr:copper amine oxidase N-terminal domain-containing protein [Clostridia bacterium]
MIKKILSTIIVCVLLFAAVPQAYALVNPADFQKVSEYREGGVNIISFSSKWNSKDKLKQIYEELLKNFHGEEIKLLTEIYLYPGENNKNLGEYSLSYRIDSKGRKVMDSGRYINIFECDTLDSIDKIARTLSHEYGHHFTYYYMIKKENAIFSDCDTLYQTVRGLKGNPHINNGEHKWNLAEIAAEDYVQLFGSSTFKNGIKFMDVKCGSARMDQMKNISTLPFNVYPQENVFIPLAANNPGIREYWLSAMGKDNSQCDIKTDPSYVFIDEISKINLSSYGIGREYEYNYIVRWTAGDSDPARKLEYNVVAFPDKLDGYSIPVKTVYSGEDLSACVGYFETYSANTAYTDGILDNSSKYFDVVVYTRDEGGSIINSNILRVDVSDRARPKTASILSSRTGSEIQVIYNKSMIKFDDARPVLINNRTMVPLRKIFETMGAQIEWEDSTKTVTAKKDNNVIVMQIENARAFVNGKEIVLDAAPQLVNNRTLVPLRFVGQSFGNIVEWDGTDRTVVIK